MSADNIYSAELINRLLPETLAVAEIEAKYPPRKLAEGQKVSRQGPSPTGFMHIGTVSTSLITRLFLGDNGIFFLRIEDTDQKRKVDGATELIVQGLKEYGIRVDEGPTLDGSETGAYGPYTQSKRGSIYKAYAKKLLSEGKAYPCFCTEAELEELRKTQEYENIRPGYYGKWALHRDLTEAEIKQKLDAGLAFVIRLRADGNYEKMMKIEDLVKGERFLPENDIDIVLLKSDGMPTYHFAHVIDDHLMGTTHVVRADEWFNSVPLHLQLFRAMGWRAPKYGHISPIQKLDEGNRRKLSKRKDPEASAMLFVEKGYPQRAVIEYLLNLANSNFEDWRRANPKLPYEQFQFSIKKLGTTGALFDFAKLNNVSRDYISRMSTEEIFAASYTWAGKYDAKLKALMDKDPAYVKQILNIERTGSKIRKDITTWSDVYNEIAYFFDEEFALTKEQALGLVAPVSSADAASFASAFATSYNPADDKDTWFNKIKKIADEHGYAGNIKDFQANPTAFKGNVSDVAKVFRVLLTGRAQTPDLHSVMLVMGKERCLKRLGLLK